MKKRILLLLCVMCISIAQAAATDKTFFWNFDQDSQSDQLFTTFVDEKTQNTVKNTFPSKFYYINSGAYANEEWFKKVDENIFSQNDNSLHIFSFNVGEGNCIVLRKKDDVVIIDAGFGGKVNKKEFTETILPKIKAVLGAEKKPVTLQAVLITAPIENRYNLVKELSLLKSIKQPKEGVFTNCPGKVCGITTKELKPGKLPWGNDVIVDISSGKNTKDLVIKVTYKGQTVLFTGEEDGYFPETIGDVKDEEHTKLLSNYQKPKEDKKQDNMKIDTKELDQLSAVFLLTHKFQKDWSPKLLNYLSSSEGTITWFVSGDLDRSYYETCPFTPKRNPHFIYYAGEYNEGRRYKFTEKPFYSSVAAPGGVFWLKITAEGEMQLFDAYPELKSKQNNELVEEKFKRGWEKLSS